MEQAGTTGKKKLQIPSDAAWLNMSFIMILINHING